jgi:hypothetical protein
LKPIALLEAARVLNELLELNSILHVLPSSGKMGEVANEAIKSIPGAKASFLCIDTYRNPPYRNPRCTALCEFQAGGVEGISRAHLSYYHCPLSENESFIPIALETSNGFFGYLVVEVQDGEELSPYVPALKNFANMIAIDLAAYGLSYHPHADGGRMGQVPRQRQVHHF